MEGEDATFWRRRSSLHAALGRTWAVEGTSATVVDELRPLLDTHPTLGAFVTARFDPHFPAGDASPWAPFGRVRAWIPRAELRVDDRVARLSLVLDPGDDASTLLREPAPPRGLPGVRMTPPTPDAISRWSALVATVLDRIGDSELRKVVLARTRRFTTPGEPGFGLDLVAQLAERDPDSYAFYSEPRSGHAFVSVTPERLFRRHGRRVWSEAVAGSRVRGANRDHDHALAEELASNPKDRREHRHVSEYIVDQLRPVTHTLDVDERPRVRAMPDVQHLHVEVRGTLHETVTDGDLLTRLHPTPAVCGLPTDGARHLIGAHEGFDRGLYSGVVGRLSADDSECAVAIRSALVHGADLELHAGAGIVDGSEPLAEWSEVANKFNAVQSVLTTGHG